MDILHSIAISIVQNSKIIKNLYCENVFPSLIYMQNYQSCKCHTEVFCAHTSSYEFISYSYKNDNILFAFLCTFVFQLVVYLGDNSILEYKELPHFLHSIKRCYSQESYNIFTYPNSFSFCEMCFYWKQCYIKQHCAKLNFHIWVYIYE